jgi:hypothetical protein
MALCQANISDFFVKICRKNERKMAFGIEKNLRHLHFGAKNIELFSRRFMNCHVPNRVVVQLVYNVSLSC